MQRYEDAIEELMGMTLIQDTDNNKTYKHHTKYENGHIVDVYEEVTE
jgi:hypothetical protein